MKPSRTQNTTFWTASEHTYGAADKGDIDVVVDAVDIVVDVVDVVAVLNVEKSNCRQHHSMSTKVEDGTV